MGGSPRRDQKAAGQPPSARPDKVPPCSESGNRSQPHWSRSAWRFPESVFRENRPRRTFHKRPRARDRGRARGALTFEPRFLFILLNAIRIRNLGYAASMPTTSEGQKVLRFKR